MYTYSQLRHLATWQGIADNKVSIGLWIKFKGLARSENRVRADERYSMLQQIINIQ